jgi:N-acetylglucosaminyldiphosphoundecaprenol N-acetyl-beta-D-mannosaminyltransferase
MTPVDLLGLPVHPITESEAVALVFSALDERSAGRAFRHVALNAGKVIAARRDEALARCIRTADLVTADGAGVLALARRLGVPLPERVTGIDLMDRLCAGAAELDRSVYLLGAAPGIADLAASALRVRHPGLRVAGTHPGDWASIASEEAVVDAVAESGADLLFVALGSPRKEEFCLRWAERCGAGFVMGVGGAFDVIAGRRRRAPLALQRAGLEWAWRWAQEPVRLAPRYGADGARFVGLLMRGSRAA